MKVKDIEVGATYSNGKGRLRKVLNMGAQYILYKGQKCQDNLQYEVINDGGKKNLTRGEHHNMTIRSFASWAKERV